MLAMLFASVGIFGVFLFLTYYLQGTLGFSPVKTGVAFLPLVAALAATAQVSNRILLPRFGPKPIVPIGLLVSAAAMFGLHLVGLHSSYVSHVLPYLLVLGVGFGLSVAPAFSTGTLGLAPQDAGVGSATLNTAQQVGGSIGTSLLNTLAAGAATSYLVGRGLTPANLQGALLHSYTTAFLWSALIFVAGAVVAGLVLHVRHSGDAGRRKPDLEGGEASRGTISNAHLPCAGGLSVRHLRCEARQADLLTAVRTPRRVSLVCSQNPACPGTTSRLRMSDRDRPLASEEWGNLAEGGTPSNG